jgi:co-chaperonin GroES (HSP10)
MKTDHYHPRNDLLLVERIPEEVKTDSGIVIPGAEKTATLVKLRVIEAGPQTDDLSRDQIVLAEDMVQYLDRYRKLGLINQKFVHVIVDQNE